MRNLLTIVLLALAAAAATAAPAPHLTEAERKRAEAVPVAADFAASRWGSVAATGGKQVEQRLPAINDGKAATAAPVQMGTPVTVRFGTLFLVCRTRLLLTTDMRGGISYRVEVSENQRDWKTVAALANVGVRPVQIDTFRPVFARAIRVTIARCDAPDRLRLREVEVYGTAGNSHRYGAH